MADVDLLVEVRTAGAAAAIQALGELRKGGVSAQSAFNQLAASATGGLAAVAKAAQGGTVAATNYGRAVTSTGAKSVSLTKQLQGMEEAYRRLAVEQGKAGTAASRITTLGGGSLERGKAQIREMMALNHALSANAINDLAALDAADAQVQARRLARTQALAERSAVTTSLARARDDMAMATYGTNALDQATVRLTRATQDLARAEQERKLTTRGGAAGLGAGSAAHTAALRAELGAVREVTMAQRDYNAAIATTSRDLSHSNAFQSSFSYFIIAGMATQAAQAIRGMGEAAFGATRDIERSFVDVERTFEGTERQLTALRAKLVDLSTATPISFVDLSQIAALGNQLGIAAADIQSFTTTIAQYTAVSGQSAEDAATAFGRISNLTGLAASKYSNLASAITYVARTSVATESTIQNTAKEITALSSGAGFSAQAIVGLAGALSSLAIPPERARGALSLYFGALNEAVAEGGPKLEAFSILTNKTTQELGKLVRENKGQEVFTAFVSGLSKLDTVAKTSALDTLGLSTIRVDQTMRALAQNVPLVTQSFAGANRAFQENTEIGRQYALIQEQLASKLVEFQNAMQLAAAAVGKSLGPALLVLLSTVTDVIVGFTRFAESPIGNALMIFAGIVGTLVFAMTSLVGVAALAKASLVIIPWALSGLGASFANNAVVKFILTLFGFPPAAAAATGGLGGITAGLEATTVAAATTTTAIRATRVALLALGGVGIALAIVGTLVEVLSGAGDRAKIATDDITGLGEALKADTATYHETGRSIATFSANTEGATEEQKKAAQASKNWADVLGTDLVDGANAASDAVSKIAAGDKVVEAVRAAIGANSEIKGILSDSKFAKLWSDVGLNMTNLIKAGIRGDDINAEIDKALTAAGYRIKKFELEGGKIGRLVIDSAGNWLGTTETGGVVEDLYAVGAAAGSARDGVQGLVNTDSVLGSASEDAAAGVAALSDGFLGAASAATTFQDALSSGLSKFIDYGDIIGEIEKANKGSFSLMDVNRFGSELDGATSKATAFFSDIQALAASGRTELATQLAELGPEAQGILSGVLKLDGPAQAKIEEDARFAAFLASDAFKMVFESQMMESNQAYARIFQATGSFDEVKAFIAKQVAGAGEEAERQWAVDHPDFPLNITPSLVNPSSEDLAVYSQMLSGQITVTPTIIPPRPGTPGVRGQSAGTPGSIYTDTATGASITLPATLDGKALTASLTAWQQKQGATPQAIAAKLNTDGFNADIRNWVSRHGPIRIAATVVPQGTIPAPRTHAKGGPVEAPRFAGGGSWGQFRGAGSGTSDSLWARVSAREYINTAESTKFWGNDFFDSLNRKMLPTSFLNMLGAAAVSGNQGPQSVTNVQLTQNYPQTVNPLKKLSEDSERLVAGIW